MSVTLELQKNLSAVALDMYGSSDRRPAPDLDSPIPRPPQHDTVRKNKMLPDRESQEKQWFHLIHCRHLLGETPFLFWRGYGSSRGLLSLHLRRPQFSLPLALFLPHPLSPPAHHDLLVRRCLAFVRQFVSSVLRCRINRYASIDNQLDSLPQPALRNKTKQPPRPPPPPEAQPSKWA